MKTWPWTRSGWPAARASDQLAPLDNDTSTAAPVSVASITWRAASVMASVR